MSNLKSPGFTLLEVMLALSLVTLVLAVVAMAVHLHLRVVDSGRAEVEEAQLARALLRRIADDLRSAVQQRQTDISGMIPEGASATATAEGVLSELEGSVGPNELLDIGAEALEAQGADNTSDLAQSGEPPSVPGLYGNTYEMQVDTSRLPRIDEYGASPGDDSPEVACPSDVKNVTYYVVNDVGGLVTTPSEISAGGGGLVRREMDRATAAYAAEMGQLTDTQNVSPIAPEVVGIQFVYFDGTEVVQEWDSAERGGLPMAVEVTLYIQPKHRREDLTASARTTTGLAAVDQQDLLVYRLLVHLPIAEPTTLEGASEMPFEEAEEPEDSEASTGSPMSGGGSR